MNFPDLFYGSAEKSEPTGRNFFWPRLRSNRQPLTILVNQALTAAWIGPGPGGKQFTPPGFWFQIPWLGSRRTLPFPLEKVRRYKARFVLDTVNLVDISGFFGDLLRFFSPYRMDLRRLAEKTAFQIVTIQRGMFLDGDPTPSKPGKARCKEGVPIAIIQPGIQARSSWTQWPR